jgi:hypothetical protein
MRVAITGHTAGIGKAIADIFPSPILFSKSTGYDIEQQADRVKIINESAECDVFINNAHIDFGQECLLLEAWEKWKDTNKIIINIGSVSADYVHNNAYVHHRYAIQKQALESSCKYMAQSGKPCKVVLIKPGYVDTQRVSHVSTPKIDVNEFAMYIKTLIEQPYSTFWIPIVTLYPT